MRSQSSQIQAPHYLDGVVSVPQSVTLSLTDQSVLIIKEGVHVARWAYTKIFVKEDWLDEVGCVLGFKDQPESSLVIYNKREFQSIQSRLPHWHRASFILPHKYRHLFVMALGAIIVTLMIFPLLHNLAALATLMVPHSLEKKLGNLVIEDMEGEFGICDDKEALTRLRTISDRLLMAHADKKIDMEIYLLKSSTANAFSLPGQKIAVLSGFVNDAQSENEVAAVLAHEMGHMVKRDALEGFIEAQGVGVVTGLIGSSGSYGGITQFTSLIQSMDYSRKKELQADEFGAKLLVKAGYSPSGLSTFLNRMNKKSSLFEGKAAEYEKYFEFLSTHPATTERVERLKKYEGEKFKPSLTKEQFTHLKNACKNQSESRK